MINSVTNYVDYLNHQENFWEKEVLSRVVSSAMLAIAGLETLYRAGVTLVSHIIYPIWAPVGLMVDLVELAVDDNVTGKQVLLKQCERFNYWVLQPAKKTLITAISVPLSPLVGVFSPKGMVAMLYDLELAENNLEKAKIQAARQAERENKEKLESNFKDFKNAQLEGRQELKREVDAKFLYNFTNPGQIEKYKRYKCAAPRTMVIHGAAKSGKTGLAKYAADKLGMNLRVINNHKPQFKIDDLELTKDLIYFKNSKGSEDTIKLLRNRGYIVIHSTEDKMSEQSRNPAEIHVEIKPMSSVDILFVIMKLIPEEIRAPGLTLLHAAEALQGCTIKEITTIVNEAKLIALNANSKVTEEMLLGQARDYKKVGGRQPAQVEMTHQQDFVGMEDLLKIFDRYIKMLLNPAEARERGVSMPAGMILHGAPGCGKTHTARYLAQYAATKGLRLNFMQIKGSDVASKYKGEGLLKIRKAYEEAKSLSPCILFIDECEGLFPSRDSLTDTLASERIAELDEALQLIDDAKKHNIIIVGATNHIKMIDPAILRTGRFDFTYEVKLPDERTRFMMLKSKLNKTDKKFIDNGIDLARIAEMTEGFTASDIDALINNASTAAWMANSNINQEILLDSLKLVSRKKESVTTSTAKEPSKQMETIRNAVSIVKDFLRNLDKQDLQVAGDGAPV